MKYYEISCMTILFFFHLHEKQFPRNLSPTIPFQLFQHTISKLNQLGLIMTEFITKNNPNKQKDNY